MDKLRELRANETQKPDLLAETQAENRRLSEELQNAKYETAALRAKLQAINEISKHKGE